MEYIFLISTNAIDQHFLIFFNFHKNDGSLYYFENEDSEQVCTNVFFFKLIFEKAQ